MSDLGDPSEAPVLSVRDLRTWFDTPRGIVKAVDGACVDVRAGGAMGVVGESGSGKTQLFLSVFGLSWGSPGLIAGKATALGVDLLDGLDEFVHLDVRNGTSELRKAEGAWGRRHERALREVRGRVGFIFQESKASLVPYWTVARHFRALSVDAPDEGETSWRERSEGVLARLGFVRPRGVLGAFPEQLSGGEAQRVMLALTVARDPTLLIADEPTSSVDAVSQGRILDQIGSIADAPGRSLVIISHDPAVVRLLSRRLVVLFRGAVVERLTTELMDELPADELHPYTCELRESQRARARDRAIEPGIPDGLADEVDVGCPYRGRCSLYPRLATELQSQCENRAPRLVEITPDHAIACWAKAGG